MSLFTTMLGAAAAAAGGASAPTNAVAPSITGSPTVGSTLVANAGSWNGTPTPSTTGEWDRSSNPSTGAYTLLQSTATNYIVTAADLGKYITVLITAKNASGTATARSTSVGPIVDSSGPPAPVSPPVITTP